MAFVDKTLACRDCNKQFTFTAGEQEFYAQKGLQNEPRRCPECRSTKRQSSAGSSGAARQMFAAVCASCGATTQVPFQPKQDRPVYCSACFSKQKPRT